MASVEPIVTARLELRPLTHAFLEATVAGDREAMERVLGAQVPGEWPGDAPLDLWSERTAADADLHWLARGVILREQGTMIGHAGFHLPPGAPDLARWAPGGVELGYTIFEPYRRRGYATEAVIGLLAFARTRDVPAVLATTETTNEASKAVLRRCGFEAIDRVEDGETVEDVWVTRLC